MLDVYGIKNCSTVKKALNWLDQHNKAYRFHDYKKTPATQEQLQRWAQEVSWERLLNKRGTTWRRLSTEQQEAVVDSASAIAVLRENNSMIKRPLIESPNGILLGFDDQEYQSKL